MRECGAGQSRGAGNPVYPHLFFYFSTGRVFFCLWNNTSPHPMPTCTDQFNFVQYKPYTEVLLADGMSPKEAKKACAQHSERNGRDFFFQQIETGTTFCGFFETPLETANKDTAILASANYGGLCRAPSATSAECFFNIPLKSCNTSVQ